MYSSQVSPFESRSSFLPFSPPSIGAEEIEEVVDTLRSGWISTGPKVKRFETEFAGYIGAPAALAVSSATGGMMVSLAALGVGRGDEVITTAMTFCSTVHVIEHLGATPVLVDVEPDTLNIDPARVERAITPRTRAIIPVHLYGHPCEMEALYDIAARRGLSLVQDSAHALPARYRGATIGSRADTAMNGRRSVKSLTCFSFYATKNMTTAEGGMVTGAPDLIDSARVWSLHGMNRDAYKRYCAEGSWFYEVVAPGFKCNMTDIQAAIGLQQLKKLPAFQARRREIVERYHAAFRGMDELEVPTERPEVESAWHLYVIRLNLERLSIDRSAFIEELKRRNIGASVHFIPIHLHAYYRDKYGFAPADFPVAYQQYLRMVSLPLYPGLTDRDVEDVIGAVLNIVARNRSAR
jgi:dTDP-4-amino-4,6-dideoxygalactose transaminase